MILRIEHSDMIGLIALLHADQVNTFAVPWKKLKISLRLHILMFSMKQSLEFKEYRICDYIHDPNTVLVWYSKY